MEYACGWVRKQDVIRTLQPLGKRVGTEAGCYLHAMARRPIGARYDRRTRRNRPSPWYAL